MNFAYIRYLFGRVLEVFAGLLLLPFLVSLSFSEPAINRWGFLTPGLLCLGAGFVLSRKKPENSNLFIREEMVLSALLWIILALIGALPLYISKAYGTFVDSFFEICSALTTTGLTALKNTESLAPSILFWRSFTHFLGGIGILMTALTLIPRLSFADRQRPRFKSTDVKKWKWRQWIFDPSFFIFFLYFFMGGILFLLLLRKMPFFDALCQTFATAGSGAFTTKGATKAIGASSYLRWVITFFMLVFSLNFQLFFAFFVGKGREPFKNEEVSWFIGFCLISLVGVAFILGAKDPVFLKSHWGRVLTDSAFSVSSMISTTGTEALSLFSWPSGARAILLLLMFIGGTSGSLASGFKASRVGMNLKIALSELVLQRQPKRIYPARFNGHPIEEKRRRALHAYGAIYLLLFVLLFLLLVLEFSDLEPAFLTAASILNNVGPGLVPAGIIANCRPLTKVVLSLGMIAGRLEIWPLLMIFSPKTWSKY